MSAGGERGPAAAGGQWAASVPTMGPRRPTGSAVRVTPALSPLALSETTTPERPRGQSPVPPLGALHAGSRVPVPLRSHQYRGLRDSHSQRAPRQSGGQGPPHACRRPPAASAHGPVSVAARLPRVRRCVGSYGGARGGPAGVAVAMVTGKQSAPWRPRALGTRPALQGSSQRLLWLSAPSTRRYTLCMDRYVFNLS